jgi:predicted Zn finger-like uncharacterized protein
MVIECTECHTRFKLADDKVKPGGTKVRCSKCKQIFTVMPPEPEPAPPSSEEEIDFGEFNMERLTEAGKATDAAAPAEEPATTGWGEGGAGTAAGEFTVGEQTEAQAVNVASGQAARGEFAFGGEDETAVSGRFAHEEETETHWGESASGPESSEEFAFDEDEAESDQFAFAEKAETQLDSDTFSFDDSEDFSFGEEQDAGEGDTGTDEFSFDETDTSDSVEFAFDEGDTDAKNDTEFSWDTEGGDAGEAGLDFDQGDEQNAKGDEFDFTGITFGEEDAAPAGPVETERLAPAQTPPVLLETEELSPQREFAAPKKSSAPLMEQPPVFPPTTRRRKSPLQGLIFFIGLLLLAITGGAVYFYWQGGIPELTNLVDRLTGQTPSPQTGGQIRLEGMTSFYVTNKEVGQMLVIQGKAVNDYPQTRSSLAVKGVLYNKEGKTVLQQTVFCGNPLDQEALRKLPYAKIEESMNNPFGESLSNLNVAPGKAISFTIVFRNLPADIAEFTVEAADSKPGTKQ